MLPKAVSEFVVVPPSDRRREIVQHKERFGAHLRESFPEYDFTMAPSSPFDDDEFQIIPVMGKVGATEDPDEVTDIRDQPERWVLDDIVQVCRRFDVSSSKRRSS